MLQDNTRIKSILSVTEDLSGSVSQTQDLIDAIDKALAYVTRPPFPPDLPVGTAARTKGYDEAPQPVSSTLQDQLMLTRMRVENINERLRDLLARIDL